jgi:hypothetical protein
MPETVEPRSPMEQAIGGGRTLPSGTPRLSGLGSIVVPAAANMLDFAPIVPRDQDEAGLAVSTWLRATPTARFIAGKRGTMDREPVLPFGPGACFFDPPTRIV